MLLEKKLKFHSILENMRNSTKIQIETDEIQILRKKAEDYQKENQSLKIQIKQIENSQETDKELKTLKKQLKNQNKLHEADLNVLASLQNVSIRS